MKCVIAKLLVDVRSLPYTLTHIVLSMQHYVPPFPAFEREVFWDEMTTTFRGTVTDLSFHWIPLSHDPQYHNASLVRRRPIVSKRAKEVSTVEHVF
jgi:hypothetical protein